LLPQIQSGATLQPWMRHLREENIMSLSKLELRLRVEAKINEIKAQLGTLAADTTGEAQKRKHQLEARLKDAQTELKTGWEQLTDKAASKLNEWLKG
jgi:hypothetical protein